MSILLSICDNPDILKVMRIVNIVINVIKIAVPILLVIFIMIELLGAISDEEKLNKVLSSSVRKFIAAVMIFLIPTVVQLIVVVVEGNYETSEGVKNCLRDLSLDSINDIYITQAKEAVDKVKSTHDQNDYANALTVVSKIQNIDEDTYRDLKNELESIDLDKKPSGSATSDSGSSNNSTTYTKNLFMGDSRTNGMAMYGIIDSSDVEATDGGKYSDFSNHISAVSSKLSTGGYNVVLNYGVNDYSDNTSNYCTKYKEFINNYNSNNKFYVVSVNPLSDKSRNELIEKFNETIEGCVKGLKNTSYCDVYSSLSLDKWKSNNYISSDGIHYTKDGYQYIYSKITNCMK